MADRLITGTTLVEKESRSIGDVPVGGIIEFDDTFITIPQNYVECDGSTITDPLSVYNGSTIPNLNTQYLSISGMHFDPYHPDSNSHVKGKDTSDNREGKIIAGADNLEFFAYVNLPHGAVITECVVYSTQMQGTGDWTLRRINHNANDEETVASGSIDSADTTISNATIDNSGYSYFLNVTDVDTNGNVSSVKITYTPRKKYIMRIK